MIDLTKDYFLLLIDVGNSTRIPNEEINYKMKQVEEKLKELNKEFSDQIVLPLRISYGDEIAGLFHSPINFYSIIISIRKTFYPLTTVRFAAVKGQIAMDSEDIRQVGGMVFKKASSAMMILKESDAFCSWELGQMVQDMCLDSLAEMSNAILNDMSAYQREVFELLCDGSTQKQIADQLGKYTQSVWYALQRSQANHIVQAQKTINLILTETKW
jgi:hypothetical protein